MNLSQLKQARCEDCDKHVVIASEYEDGNGYYDEQASFWLRRSVYYCEACAEAAYEAEIASIDAGREWPQAENE